jgi:hydroxyacyl-ACP dehydratase HTD2-like protein with hotdog domain
MARIESIREGELLPDRSHKPGNVDLFLYNAALWNAHRIHFDHQYATEVEGYPALVIDGPLQGDWMTQVVMEWIGEKGTLLEFEYSNRKAAYLGETLTVGGRVVGIDRQAGEVEIELFVRNEADEVISPGRAKVGFSRK